MTQKNKKISIYTPVAPLEEDPKDKPKKLKMYFMGMVEDPYLDGLIESGKVKLY